MRHPYAVLAVLILGSSPAAGFDVLDVDITCEAGWPVAVTEVETKTTYSNGTLICRPSFVCESGGTTYTGNSTAISELTLASTGLGFDLDVRAYTTQLCAVCDGTPFNLSAEARAEGSVDLRLTDRATLRVVAVLSPETYWAQPEVPFVEVTQIDDSGRLIRAIYSEYEADVSTDRMYFDMDPGDIIRARAGHYSVDPATIVCDTDPTDVGRAFVQIITLSACSDSIDNDGDGAIDRANDHGCASGADDSETDPQLICGDGVDNDGDQLVDYPNDPGCTAQSDPSELGGGTCDDGLDNDLDGVVDTADPGCGGPTDSSELGTAACDDGLDNDGDAKVDFADPGCSGPADTSETDPPRSPPGSGCGIGPELTLALSLLLWFRRLYRRN